MIDDRSSDDGNGTSKAGQSYFKEVMNTDERNKSLFESGAIESEEIQSNKS